MIAKLRFLLPAWRLREHWDSALLFAAFFALYTYTLAPGLLPADSGEFQVVVPLLGVAHPPGFSLYTLLGKAFTALVPVGSYAYRLNLFSAFTSALTLVLVHLAVKRLAYRSLPAFNGLRARLRGAAWLLPPVLLGFSTTFWSQATTANIRSLAALLTSLAVLTFVQYRHSSTINRLVIFLFAISLAVVHHLSIAFIAAVLVAAALCLNPAPGRLLTRTSVLKLALAAAAPLACFLYLPLRGAQRAYLAPPGLDTLSGFVQHALGLGFGGDFFYFANPGHWPDRLAILFNIFQFQFNDLALMILALGFMLFFWQDWKLAAALALAFGVHSFVALTYRAPQTVEYLLPAYVILAVMSGSGLANSQVSAPGRRLARATLHASHLAALLLLWVAALLIFLRNLPAYKALSADDSTQLGAEGLLLTAPPEALILANWHHATPLWYLQQVSGLRPDVAVEYVFPQGESLAQNWVDRITASASQRPTLVTSYYPSEYSALPHRFLPILTALPAWEASLSPLTGLAPQPAAPTHENGWAFVDAGIITFSADNSFAQSDTFLVQTFWQAPRAPGDINFFVQLLGPDGLLYGQADVFHPAGKLAPYEVISDRVSITINTDAPVSGAYTLVAGAYLPDGRRLAPDFTEVARISIVPRAAPPATRHPWAIGLLAGYDYDLSIPDSARLYLHWRLDGRPHRLSLAASGESPLHDISLPALEGYMTTSHDLAAGNLSLELLENQSVLFRLPAPAADSAWRYVPFGPLTLIGATTVAESDGTYRVDLEWLANEPITGDYVVKVDLIGEHHTWRDQSDSIPAGGAIPTLKWIPGIVVRDRHRLTRLGESPATFQLAVYDHFTQRNLPILDARLARLGPTVQLGAALP